MDPRNRIVVTRDRVRAEPLATRLAPRGVDVVAMAVTETTHPGLPSWQALVEAVGRGHDHIAVASGNAAEALVRAVAEARRELPEVVAVGAITVGVLARHGIVAIAAARADSVGLAEELIERGARLVLWPRSDQGREEGLARLVEAGIAFEAPVAYRTITRAADAPGIAEGLAALADAAAVCVYAPSQAVALDALVAGGLAGLRAPLIAIGDTTAAAVTARGGRVASIAASPDPDAMASAVLAVLSGEP